MCKSELICPQEKISNFEGVIDLFEKLESLTIVQYFVRPPLLICNFQSTVNYKMAL